MVKGRSGLYKGKKPHVKVALLNLSSWCLVALPRGAGGCLRFVIVVFPDHTHLQLLALSNLHSSYKDLKELLRLISNLIGLSNKL